MGSRIWNSLDTCRLCQRSSRTFPPMGHFMDGVHPVLANLFTSGKGSSLWSHACDCTEQMRKWLLRAQQLSADGNSGKEKSPSHAKDMLMGKNLALQRSWSKLRAPLTKTWRIRSLEDLTSWEQFRQKTVSLKSCFMRPLLQAKFERCPAYRGQQRGSQLRNAWIRTWPVRFTGLHLRSASGDG